MGAPSFGQVARSHIICCIRLQEFFAMSLVMSRLVPVLVAAVLAAVPTFAQATERVALQSRQNDAYVCLRGDFYAAACRGPQAAVFDLQRLSGGEIAFRDTRNGRYMRAGLTQGTLLGIGNTRIGTWERFQMQEWNGSVFLRSPQAGAFVRAGIGQEALLGAVSPHTRGWEEFRLVPVGSQASGGSGSSAVPFAGRWNIQALANGNRSRLTLPPGGGDMVVATDGSFRFSFGCNEVTGRFVTPSGQDIRLQGGLQTTFVNCQHLGAAMPAERSMSDMLPEVVSFDIENGRWFLLDRRGVARIGMVRR
jgi:hypothetical protein